MQFMADLIQGVALFCGHKALSRRPASEIADKMVQIPVCRHFEFWRSDPEKREGEIGKILNEVALQRPERHNHFIAKTIHNRIEWPARCATNCKLTQPLRRLASALDALPRRNDPDRTSATPARP